MMADEFYRLFINEGEDFKPVDIEKKHITSEFFQQAINEDNPSKFWQNFPFPFFIQYGLPQLAISEINRVLHECINIDHEAYIKYHKGNPYYWLGFSYFVLQDYQSACFFMDAAVREDLNREPVNYPSPATYFIELDSNPETQAGRDLVKFAEKIVIDQIAHYNQLFNTQYTISDIRDNFLKRATKPQSPTLQSLATAFISFTLEFNKRNMELVLVDNPNSKEPLLLHLFKGCVLLESLLKTNPLMPLAKDNLTLGPILQLLHTQLGIINDINTRSPSLQDVINQLKDFDKSLDMSFEITAKTRNTVGHSLAWEINMDIDQYKKLYDIIFICCLHVIFTLYN